MLHTPTGALNVVQGCLHSQRNTVKLSLIQQAHEREFFDQIHSFAVLSCRRTTESPYRVRTAYIHCVCVRLRSILVSPAPLAQALPTIA